MRVYFSPCGVGLGHVGRCIPVARKLIEKGYHVVFSTYNEGVRYVEEEKFSLVKVPSIGFQVKPDGTIDFRQTAVNPGPFLASLTLMKQVNAEIEAIESFRPDVIVADSRISPLIAARILRMPRICILNQFQVIIPRKRHYLRLARFVDSITLRLIGKIWTSGNVVLIPDFPPPYTISTGNLNIPRAFRRKVKLIGPILPRHPSGLPSKRELRKGLRLSADKSVIFVPISGPTREKAFLASILRDILLEFPEKYEIIMSLGYPNADSEPIQHGNLRIYKWISRRFEYLKACDLVISRAGHGTLTQCISYGKPMVLVPTPSHTEQLNNAKQAEKLGIARIVNQQEISKETLLGEVRKIFESEISEKLRLIQEEVSEYDGLKNVVKMISETGKAG